MIPHLHPPIVRHVVYPIYRGLRGDELLPMLERFERDQWLPGPELEELQWRRLSTLISRAAARVPYYRDLFARLSLNPADISGPEGLRRLPLLDRASIREAGRDLITTDPMRRGFPLKTAGTTGEPLRFFGDVSAGPARRANTLRGLRWAGVDIGDRQAVLSKGPPDGPPSQRIREGIRNYFSNQLLIDASDMSAASMRRGARILRRYRPSAIIGPPRSLERLCRFCEEEGIEGIAPTAIITCGEPLTEGARAAIERCFGRPVFDRYSTAEFDCIAHECPEHSGLHLFSDLFYAEVIDERGEPAPPGEPGELVITDLSNHYMPFIRYRTGDIAVLSRQGCRCGRGLPLIERIEGRLKTGTAGKSPAARQPVSPARGAGDRLIVKSKIHKARITGEEPLGMDCLVVDGRLLEISNIAVGEKVLIVDNTNGSRVETFAIAGPEGKGAITVCGAAAKHIRAGDEVSIMAFAWAPGLPGDFKNILVDSENRFVRFLTDVAGEML